jgi:uncharacterized protein YkwD
MMASFQLEWAPRVFAWWQSDRITARRRRGGGIAPRTEALEVRRVLTVDLTNVEQLVLELINRARANPEAEVTRLGLTSLNEGLAAGTISSAAKAPLAPNQLLTNASRLHSQDMYNRQFFDHNTPDGRTAFDRIRDAGYTFTTAGENIAFWSRGSFGAVSDSELTALRNAAPTGTQHHDGLFRSPGHRTNLMSDNFLEVGLGLTVDRRKTGNGTESYLTEKFGTRSGDAFLVGVAFRDAITVDNFYTVGEGLGGVTIVATHSNGTTYTTTTGSAGGYALQVPNGTYTIQASGGPLAASQQRTGITVSAKNQKVDFVDTGLTAPALVQDSIGTLRVLQQGAGGRLFPAARVTAGSESNLNAATLVVAIASAGVGDRLSIDSVGTAAGQISVASGTVSFGGTAIGTVSGGSATTPLTVTFNAQATYPAIQALVRVLRYASETTTPPSGSRVVTGELKVGTSAPASLTRSVEIAALNASTSENRFYRAYNPNADYHFFTTSFGEFTNAVAAGYRDETNGQQGFSIPAQYVSGTTIVHRMYNLANGRHYYTLNSAERDILVQTGWRFEKDEGYMFTGPGAGRVEVFRLYNTITGVHLYTENADIRTAILAQFPGIWVQHDSLGFAQIASATPPAAPAIAAANSPVVETSELVVSSAASGVSLGLIGPVVSVVATTVSAAPGFAAATATTAPEPFVSQGLSSFEIVTPLTIGTSGLDLDLYFADADFLNGIGG